MMASITPRGETEISPVQAADRIEAFAREGRLVQDIWRGERRGREVACLLGAISERINDRRACPASVMPAWVAYMLPDLHDRIPVELVGPLGVRFARALRRTQDWPTEPGGAEACPKWRAVRGAWVSACVTGAMDAAWPVLEGSAWWPEASAAAEAVVAALQAGDPAVLRVARDVARPLALATETPAAWLAAWAATEGDEALRKVAFRAVELGEQAWATARDVRNPIRTWDDRDPTPTWADLYRALLDAMEAEA